MSLWSETVRPRWHEVERLSEDGLRRFAAACVTHALGPSLPEFAGCVRADSLRVAQEGVAALREVESGGRPRPGAAALARRIEAARYGLDSEEDAVYGWDSALGAIQVALLCAAGEMVALNARTASQLAYEVVAEAERAAALWERGGMDADQMAAVERASADCQDEARFQMDLLARL